MPVVMQTPKVVMALSQSDSNNMHTYDIAGFNPHSKQSCSTTHAATPRPCYPSKDIQSVVESREKEVKQLYVNSRVFSFLLSKHSSIIYFLSICSACFTFSTTLSCLASAASCSAFVLCPPNLSLCTFPPPPRYGHQPDSLAMQG